MTLGQLAYKQAEDSDDIMYDVILHSGSLKQFLAIADNVVDIMINDKNLFSVTPNGIQTSMNQHNVGSVARKRDAYFTCENLQKEFFIPSSIVTPIPSRLPWLGALNVVMRLSSFFSAISGLSSFWI